MIIQLHDIGKKYNKTWVFRRLNFQFDPPKNIAITGPNGSGKSTLLKIIAGKINPSEGRISHTIKGNQTDPDKVYQHISFAAPYLELIEEFTLEELIAFHTNFKSFIHGIKNNDAIELSGLKKASNKRIRHYSSGMKQRVKLLLAILSETPVILLDEPASNLDANGIEWFHSLINDYTNSRLLIVCSNMQKDEISFCTASLRL